MTSPEVVGENPEVEVLDLVLYDDVLDFMRLLPQLSSKPLPSFDVVATRLLAAANQNNADSRVVIIRDEAGRIQASATGTICRIPTGEKPWVDDVVTDENYRGRG
jgi:hypothetical protein